MDENNPEVSHFIITSEEGAQFDSVQQNTSFIVKLDNVASGSNSCPIYPKYIPSLPHNLGNENQATEIAFEIIQEPLLEDGIVVDNSRFLFNADVTSVKDTHHLNGNNHNVLIDRCHDESLIIKSGEKQSNSDLQNYSLEEMLITNDIDNNNFNTSTSSISSFQPSTSSVIDGGIKVEILNPTQCKEEEPKSPEVIKKTIVDAFVKMTVCRKITVEKRDVRTGNIVDINVKLEENEPVILGIDCVETTEDISGQPSQQNLDADDDSVMLLKSLSENSRKTNKCLQIIQSTLKKEISKVLGQDRYAINDATSKDESVAYADKDVVKSSCAEREFVHKIEDNNEDNLSHLKPKQNCSVAELKHFPKDVNVSNIQSDGSSGANNAKTPNNIFGRNEDSRSKICIPKKRGRKRKWDRTIGLTPNLKTCQFCNTSFDNVDSCKEHMKKGNCISSHHCFICSKQFDSETELEKHIFSHRHKRQVLSFDCLDCKRSYRTKAGYIKHFRMGTCKKRDEFEDGETGDFTCEECKSRFSSMNYLQLHQIKVHENPKDRHICPDCGKTFYSLQGFQRHRSGRPCMEPLKCYICGKTYKAKESFKLHMKHHKSEITGITFNCDECGRSYMTETALSKHKMLHTGIKPYKCEICHKEFAMRYQVKDHARVHSGERPYSCTICGAAFSNKGHLGRHSRSHENGTLFKRGRPKKKENPDSIEEEEPDIKLIDLGQTIQTVDGQAIQLVDEKVFNAHVDRASKIFQTNKTTIIIAEGWQGNSIPHSVLEKKD